MTFPNPQERLALAQATMTLHESAGFLSRTRTTASMLAELRAHHASVGAAIDVVEKAYEAEVAAR